MKTETEKNADYPKYIIAIMLMVVVTLMLFGIIYLHAQLGIARSEAKVAKERYEAIEKQLKERQAVSLELNKSIRGIAAYLRCVGEIPLNQRTPADYDACFDKHLPTTQSGRNGQSNERPEATRPGTGNGSNSVNPQPTTSPQKPTNPQPGPKPTPKPEPEPEQPSPIEQIPIIGPVLGGLGL